MPPGSDKELKAIAMQHEAAALQARERSGEALRESHRLLELKTEELALSLFMMQAAMQATSEAEEALRDESRILELLNRVGRNLTSKLDLRSVVQAVTDAGTEIGGAQFGMFISSVSPAGAGGEQATLMSTASGNAFTDLGKALAAALAESRLDWQKTFHCDDLLADEPMRQMLTPSAPCTARSLMLVPVISRPGEVLGALVFGHESPGAFSDRSERILGGLAAQAAVAIDNARLYTQIRREVNEQRLLSRLQKEYLERLRNMSRRLIGAEEQERARLGRELHDRVGSNLSALLLGLALMRSELPPPAADLVARRLSDFEQILLETMEHVRDVLSDLRPVALDELGLVAALRHHAAVLAARTGVDFMVAGNEPAPRMRPACEIAFFRIAQEALTNVLKHAQAKRVHLTVGQKGRVVTMRIEDDGTGFDPAARVPGSPSLGLTVMRERAEAIGAVLSVDAAPGAGARLNLHFTRSPVQPGAA